MIYSSDTSRKRKKTKRETRLPQRDKSIQLFVRINAKATQTIYVKLHEKVKQTIQY